MKYVIFIKYIPNNNFGGKKMNTAVTRGAIQSKQQVLQKQVYTIVQEELYQFELGKYHTYGIQVITPEYTDILHDVSTCEKTVEYIVELLNCHDVSPVHLHDIVMDMLP